MSTKRKPETRPPSTVTVFDITIPAHDYLTAWELERIELLAAQQPESATRHDLEVLAVFIESRVGTIPDLDKLERQPIHADELTKAVEVLVTPFVIWQLARVRRRHEQAMRLLTPDQRIAELQSELSELQSSASGTPN